MAFIDLNMGIRRGYVYLVDILFWCIYENEHLLESGDLCCVYAIEEISATWVVFTLTR